MALTSSEVERQRNIARAVEGKRLMAVHYLTLDYVGLYADAPPGRRLVLDDSEWASPYWQFPDSDSVDWGVDLHFEDGSQLALTWETPNAEIEGILLSTAQPLQSSLSAECSIAIWDVGLRSRWKPFLGQPVGPMTLHHANWGPTSAESWLPWLTLHIGVSRVEFLLGEGDTNPPGPSADNLVVLFDPVALPNWLRGTEPPAAPVLPRGHQRASLQSEIVDVPPPT